MEGVDYGVAVENVFAPHVDAYGWEINPELLTLNRALNVLSNKAAQGVLEGNTTEAEYEYYYSQFLDSCVKRTIYSLIPAMEAVWADHPDAQIGGVVGLGHVLADKSMTRFLPPREQQIVTAHRLVSQEESPLAETLINNGGFVVLGEPFSFGSLQPPVRRTAQPRRTRRWL